MSSPSFSLPDRPSLEHLKAQAKDLLAAYRANDSEAKARFQARFPGLASPTLRDAHLVIAREYGFASWTKLKAHVLLRSTDSDLEGRAAAFVTQAMERETGAEVAAALATTPALSDTSLAAACAAGNTAAVARFLDTDPALLNAKIPPKGWDPLLYVCFSVLLKNPEYRPALIETARYLIGRGADVNATWPAPEWGTTESCLYGATGVNDCLELAEILLKAGANPNDDECLYHASELPTPDCLRLLMEYGGDIASHNALAHMLDREEPDWLRMMLSYVKDPSRIPPVIPFALRRGRSAECVRILIEAGIDLNAPDPGQGNLTPYQVATRLARTDVTDLLAEAGANTALTEGDEIVGRLARGEPVDPATIAPSVIASIDAEKPTPTVVVLAERNVDSALETLLSAGADPNVTDTNGWTGLHIAALNGKLETVRILLRHKADPNIIEKAHNASPCGFAGWASLNMRKESPETYVEIVRELLDAGATVPEQTYGSPEVSALLVERGAKPAPAA